MASLRLERDATRGCQVVIKLVDCLVRLLFLPSHVRGAVELDQRLEAGCGGPPVVGFKAESSAVSNVHVALVVVGLQRVVVGVEHGPFARYVAYLALNRLALVAGRLQVGAVVLHALVVLLLRVDYLLGGPLLVLEKHLRHRCRCSVFWLVAGAQVEALSGLAAHVLRVVEDRVALTGLDPALHADCRLVLSAAQRQAKAS